MLGIFSVSFFIIFWAMVGYPLSLWLLDKIVKPKPNVKDLKFEPNVTLMIVAHNEDSVIESKLNNAISLDYPQEKLQILVASDNSNDDTNVIVENFIREHKEWNILLHKTLEHKGKTNAQNEGQKLATGEILVMTDANSMLDNRSIRELVSYFAREDIAYVCGKLVYSNTTNNTSNSESSYWNLDLYMRDVESKIQAITAGNGAIYACRNKEYIAFQPIFCHDSAMPYEYAIRGKKALFNPNALAYEKSGESDGDEYKRKVRMNRDILTWLKLSFKTFNVFKYKWFSFFFFSHRFCRYMLWFAHLTALLTSIIAFMQGKKWGKIMTLLQIVLISISGLSLKFKLKNKLVRMIGYYSMTIFAQLVGVKNCLTGQSKATWEKVESTR